MIQDKEFRELCEKAREQVKDQYPDLTPEQVVLAVKASFGFAREHIKKGSLTPIYFQFLGRFVVKQGRQDYLKKRKEQLDDSKQSKLSVEGDTIPSSEEPGMGDILETGET
jgi:uncharacterized GH25 family protein